MAQIDLIHITKSFGAGVAAVNDLTLTIPHGHFVCLLGPSGCGKTTTLRMVAGLEMPERGEIRQDGKVLFSSETGQMVPPEKRGMGLVFQSYALWPHMTVAQNIAFGLEMQGMAKAERAKRVGQLMDLLRITGLEARYPLQLSGGQQQRVALARMLAVSPDVLLLDEPLSNLDAKLRLEMRAELKRLHEQLGNTVIYVTHDQLEAMTMSTEIALMCSGCLQQFAPPLEVYRRPANVFIAEFVGNPPMNLFDVDNPEAAGVVRSIRNAVGSPEAAIKTIGLRPEAVALLAEGVAVPAAAWSHAAVVDAVLPAGAEWTVSVSVDGTTVFARATEEPAYAPHQAVTVMADPRQFHLFDAAGRRLSLS